MPADCFCSKYRPTETQYSNFDQSNALVRRFDCPRDSLKLALEHDGYPPENRGKHTVRDRDSEQQIRDSIRENTERSTPVTRQEINH
jgi:hypothetical protein